jgi:hypothetical protein
MPRVVRGFALSVLVVALLGGSARAAERVNDAEHGFVLTVPDGFVDAPEAMAPRVLHAYKLASPPEGSFALVQLQALSGTIGREPVDRAEAEKAMREVAGQQGAPLSGFDYRKVKWKGFDLDLMVVWMGDGDTKVVTLATQVPLRKQAVQVQIVGPAAQEAALAKHLDGFLAGLDGRSNWLSDAERSEKLGGLVGTVVGALLVVVGTVWWTRRKRAGRA